MEGTREGLTKTRVVGKGDFIHGRGREEGRVEEVRRARQGKWEERKEGWIRKCTK